MEPECDKQTDPLSEKGIGEKTNHPGLGPYEDSQVIIANEHYNALFDVFIKAKKLEKWAKDNRVVFPADLTMALSTCETVVIEHKDKWRRKL